MSENLESPLPSPPKLIISEEMKNAEDQHTLPWSTSGF